MTKNPFDFFDRMYAINLDDRGDRWAELQKQFKNVNIHHKVQRFSAIKDARYAYGCCASHVEIIKLARKDGLSNVFIFEDDACFYNFKHEVLSQAIDRLKETDWSVFRLGYNFLGDDLQIERLSDSLLRVKKGGLVCSTVATAYHAPRFDEIIENYDYDRLFTQKDPFRAVDRWMSKHYDSYCLVPMMVVQNERHKPMWHMNNYNRYVKPLMGSKYGASPVRFYLKNPNSLYPLFRHYTKKWRKKIPFKRVTAS
jgi:GR25 family glycosyltransferase involved in LPS biosynthesis